MSTELAPGYELHDEPYYLPLADEVEVFMAAYAQRLPVLLKGPTGCGKTRFVEYMAHRIYRQGGNSIKQPLQTVACHEDLSATDLVGRFLLKSEETVWQDGPLSRAVKEGSICYLDEIVEARKDSTVLIHSLTDHRRIQNVLKDLKPSTRQRFIAIDFDYPEHAEEARIIAHESGVSATFSDQLARIGQNIRNLRSHGFDEGVSTRLLVYAGQLIVQGVLPRRACDAAISKAVSDDVEVQRAIAELVDAVFPSD